MTPKDAVQQSVKALVASQKLARLSDEQLLSAKPLRVALQRLSEAWGDVARELNAMEKNDD